MGVPIAAWPMHSDQPCNTILVSEVLKCGVVVREWVHRKEVVSVEAIETAVRKLMVSEEGKEIRKRADEVVAAACCSETVLIEELAAAVHEFELLPFLTSAAVAVPCFASLWKEEKISEAEKLQKMDERGYGLDIVTCNIVIGVYSYSKHGKISSALRVLRDMENRGCNPTTCSYNLLIRGLGARGHTDEIYSLMNEMKEKGISPDIFTYNYLIGSLCEVGRMKDATSLLDAMVQNCVYPTVSSFCLLIRAFFKSCDFEASKETFEIALSICGHKKRLYRLMLNELLVRGKVSEANELFLVIMDRGFDVRGYTYKNLIEGLCKDEMLDEACKLLRQMLGKTHGFDPSSFISVIDALGKSGNQHEANEFSESMMEMASDVTEEKKRNGEVYDGKELDHRKQQKDGFRGTEWRNISHRDDGSGVALKVI
ncbi:hypothetical protein GIB67_038285, partial [Kingdonia uniflora]